MKTFFTHSKRHLRIDLDEMCCYLMRVSNGGITENSFMNMGIPRIFEIQEGFNKVIKRENKEIERSGKK